MNLEKVIFGFFILLAATLNFGFFIGDIARPELHNVYELFAAITVNLIATVLKFGDRTQIGAIHLATSLVADLQLIAAAIVWAMAVHVTGAGMTVSTTSSVLSLSGGALFAGLRHPKCRGVLALTDDEQANLGIAIAARLMNPHLPVLACARTPRFGANMASFGTDHIINPFERFAEYLALAVAAPQRYRLIEILTGLPDSVVPPPHLPPRGRWIICGYGRFGRAIVQHLAPTGIELTVIDPEPVATAGICVVRGLGTEAATLSEAGVDTADGIVAGSDSDINNLSIAVTAQKLNPRLFVVTRQNQTANSQLFDAFRDDFCMVPPRIIAQECIATLTTPLLTRFLDLVRGSSEAWCQALAGRLEDLGSGHVPEIWGLCLNAGEAPAVYRALVSGAAIVLGQLLRDNVEREHALAVMPLMLEREGERHVTPDAATPLAPGDALLFAGGSDTQRRLELTLQNANVLDYVLTGREHAGGWLAGRF